MDCFFFFPTTEAQPSAHLVPIFSKSIVLQVAKQQPEGGNSLYLLIKNLVFMENQWKQMMTVIDKVVVKAELLWHKAPNIAPNCLQQYLLITAIQGSASKRLTAKQFSPAAH